ncbi:MAG: hypothetical protein R3E77_01405 [Steroidobacteraceae bacterium]
MQRLIVAVLVVLATLYVLRALLSRRAKLRLLRSADRHAGQSAAAQALRRRVIKPAADKLAGASAAGCDDCPAAGPAPVQNKRQEH